MSQVDASSWVHPIWYRVPMSIPLSLFRSLVPQWHKAAISATQSSAPWPYSIVRILPFSQLVLLLMSRNIIRALAPRKRKKRRRRQKKKSIPFCPSTPLQTKTAYPNSHNLLFPLNSRILPRNTHQLRESIPPRCARGPSALPRSAANAADCRRKSRLRALEMVRD